jgi:hypothetical protein
MHLVLGSRVHVESENWRLVLLVRELQVGEQQPLVFTSLPQKRGFVPPFPHWRRGWIGVVGGTDLTH